MNAQDIVVAIDPFSYHFENDRLFDSNFAPHQGGENIMAPYVHLKQWFAERNVRVHTADRLLRGEVGGTHNVFISFGLQERYKHLANRNDVALSAFFGFECPVVAPGQYSRLHRVAAHFKRVYSFSDAQSLAPLLKRRLNLCHFCLPYPLDTIRDDLWGLSNRKFLVMINHHRAPALAWNELYTERFRAIEFFARNDELELYGRGWDGAPYQPRIAWLPGTAQRLIRFSQNRWYRFRPLPYMTAARRVWKGFVQSKLDVLGQYTFSICFDNTKVNGWITEKIFDCFVAGCIPVYWGAPDIVQYVPQDCFIDMRRFDDYSELRNFLKGLGAAHIRSYKEAARDFMTSPKFRPFTKQTFTERLGRIVEEDTGTTLGVTPAGGDATARTQQSTAFQP